MKTVDIVRRASRNLSQAKGRTILTSLAIAVGAYTLTLALAAGEGTRNYGDSLIKTNIDPQAIFVVKDKEFFSVGGQSGLREYDPDVSASSFRPGTTVRMMTNEDIEKLSERADLARVIPMYTLSPTYFTFEGSDKRWMGGVDYYDTSMLYDTSAGSLPELGMQIGDGEVIVPEAYTKTLGKSPSELVGTQLSIRFAQARADVSEETIQQTLVAGGPDAVKQLLEPKNRDVTLTIRAVTKASAMALQATPQIVVSVEAAKSVSEFQRQGTKDEGKYLGVTAVAKEGRDPAAIKKELEAAGYAAQTAKDAQGQLFTIVAVLQGIVGGFGLLALIASVFGIVNTQYISVLERTSQIGLMKALGMRSNAIGKLFRYEAAWIGFIGGLIGVGLALITGLFLNPFISDSLGLGDAKLIEFVPLQIGLLLTALVLIGIAAGWLPSRKAAKLDPIEALRTE